MVCFAHGYFIYSRYNIIVKGKTNDHQYRSHITQKQWQTTWNYTIYNNQFKQIKDNNFVHNFTISLSVSDYMIHRWIYNNQFKQIKDNNFVHNFTISLSVSDYMIHRWIYNNQFKQIKDNNFVHIFTISSSVSDYMIHRWMLSDSLV